VLIRCEKCSTLYDLDDKLLPPQGAPVQCSKCHFVFKAYPSPAEPARQPELPVVETPPPEPIAGANGVESPEDLPAMDAARPVAAERRGHIEREVAAQDDRPAERASESGRLSSVVVRESGALVEPGAGSLDGGGPRLAFPASRAGSSGGSMHGGARSGPVGSGEQQFTADGRPIRKVPFPVSEPSPPGGGRPSGAAVTGRRPVTAGTPRLIPVVAVVGIVVLVLVAVIAWTLLRGRAAPGAEAPPGRAAPGEGAAVSRPAPPAGTPATAPGK
jgi:predicted Zn finger-like uncharacterized protein